MAYDSETPVVFTENVLLNGISLFKFPQKTPVSMS